MKTHTRRCESCHGFFFATAKDTNGHVFECPTCREVPAVIHPGDYETVRITGITCTEPKFWKRGVRPF